MATLRDVAKAVGVSESTVSRALQRPETVAADTLTLIRHKVTELGYKPRGSAAPAKRTKLPMIAVLVPDIANPYFAAIVKAIQVRAQYRSYRVMIADSNEDRTRELEYVSGIEDDVSGIIFVSPRSDEAVIAQLAPSIPMVLTSSPHPVIPSVVIDESQHIDRIMTHLRALGHQRIAYVGGPTHSTPNQHRLAALHQYEAANPEVEFVYLGSYSAFPQGGFSAADEVIASGVSAVIAFNDMVAMGLVSRMHERGLQIPQDISIVGFDDVIMAAVMQPALSTVHLPLEELGTTALDLLHEWIETKIAPPSAPSLFGELVVRQSTGVATPAPKPAN